MDADAEVVAAATAILDRDAAITGLLFIAEELEAGRIGEDQALAWIREAGAAAERVHRYQTEGTTHGT